MDLDILRALPKVCLHEHLDGCLRPATVAQLAEQSGVPLPFRHPNSATGSSPRPAPAR